MKLHYLSAVLMCGFLHSALAHSQILADEGNKLATQLGAELKTELGAALKTASFENAVTVCKQKAPKIAKRISLDSGADVGRVSLKYRNPNNKPSAWESEVLAYFEHNPFEAESFYYDDGTSPIKYMKAIKTEGLCLSCHGTDLSNPVKNAVQKHYPADLATGYALGEIRGAFSVSWPAETDSIKIKNFGRITKNLWVGAQPTAEQLATLKELNLGTIINLRPASEMPFDEEKTAAALGINYLNLAIAGASDINIEKSKQLDALIENAKTPIFLHCSSANRVGALLALSSFRQGLNAEESLRVGRLTGMSSLAEHVESLIKNSK